MKTTNPMTFDRMTTPSRMDSAKKRGIQIQKPEAVPPAGGEKTRKAEIPRLNLFFKLLLLMTYVFSTVSLYLSFQP